MNLLLSYLYNRLFNFNGIFGFNINYDQAGICGFFPRYLKKSKKSRNF